jgi:heme exporter protein A
VRLAVENLALERGGRRLFEGLSFAAAAGELVELFGPNGAGKTSLLRALAGWLKPAEGRIRYGADADPAWAIHMLGHRDGLKPGASLAALARYWAGLLGGDEAACARALDRVGLGAIGTLPARMLSAGQARRLALTRLIVAPRPLWLLDEPMAALDDAGRGLVAALVREHLTGGGTVVAAGHDPLRVDAARTVRLGA